VHHAVEEQALSCVVDRRMRTEGEAFKVAPSEQGFGRNSQSPEHHAGSLYQVEYADKIF